MPNLRGLIFDPEKHALLPKAGAVGFVIPNPTYPIDKRQGITPGMGGNGPDNTLTVNGGNPCGDCVPNVVPKNVDYATAVMLGLQYAELTSNQIVTLYFTYQAIKAGISWRPTGNNWVAPDGLDNGVDAGDWLSWLVSQGLVAGFVTIPLSQIDGALDYFDCILLLVNLNPQADQQVEDGVPWDVGPGDEPDPEDGHGVTYNYAQSVLGPYGCWTWGQFQPFTLAWKNACPIGAIAVLTPQEVQAKGFQTQLAAFRQAFIAMGGTVPTSPPPPVITPPAPVPPVPPVTPPPDPYTTWWEKALAWAKEVVAWIEGHPPPEPPS